MSVEKNVLTLEQAIKEVDSWLDFKRIRAKKREEHKDAIENLIECFEEGIMTLNEDTKEITVNLLFPVEGAFDKLVFKPRISGDQLAPYARNVKSSDGRAVINSKIACATGQNISLIYKLDTEDQSIVDSIAFFFI